VATPFETGTIVVVTLRDPREKVWGMLLHLDATGVSIRGLDLRSFDDWLRERAAGNEPGIRASLSFYPLQRVERILVDEPAHGVPSLDSQCLERTGRRLRDLLEDDGLPPRAAAAEMS